eukprot:TRINITY_DN37382_c0_g1_i2.p1 TRINITY_DN37382_c0_g1~~TRINITY_DN37382_c0_g1_i2.p1  ORF type:complete len:420 (+),score=69.36 TRINITY_DN37382_c0_g1_i2:83-1261(+)
MDGFWDNPMIAQVAFHPSPATATHLGATSGPIRDGTFYVSDNEKVAYRLYVPSDTSTVKAVVYFFHGNAEVCTAMDDIADMLHCHGAALLSIDYRGYAWGTGKPSLTKLCSDAEACFAASHEVLEGAGLGDVKRVAHGRSIGATCAVHLASKYGGKIHGLIVDSGLMSIKQLPMVSMMAPMVFAGNPQMFQQLPEPFDTLGKLAGVACPALIMHGDQDEIVPYSQAQQCHDRLACQQKKLQCWKQGGHNNILGYFGEQWKQEIKTLLEQALEFSCEFPAGALVEAHSLSAEAMNGLQGRVLGPQGERIRVAFADPTGEKALKPTNLKIIESTVKTAEDFLIGTRVEAHSLSVAALNGVQGSVVGRNGERVCVSFPDPHGQKALKPTNLKVVG